MNKRIKVAVLLFLASLCVILASAILALVFIRGQRQTLLELKQKTNPTKSKRSSNGNKLPPFMKTKRSDHIPDQLTELRMNKYRKAPDSNDFATIAEELKLHVAYQKSPKPERNAPSEFLRMLPPLRAGVNCFWGCARQSARCGIFGCWVL